MEANNPFVQATASGIGAAASTFLCYPLQRRVVYEQANLRGSSSAFGRNRYLSNVTREEGIRGNEARNQSRFRHRKRSYLYHSPLINRATKSLLRVLKSRGFARLFYGVGPKCFADIIFNFIYFYAYTLIQNYVQRRLLKGKKSNVRGAAYLLLTNFSVLASLFAGSLAGAVTVLLTQPMDNIVTRIQVDSSEGSAYYHSRQRYCSVVYSAVMEQLSNHQMIHLWRGLVPSLFLTVNPAINHSTFGVVRAIYLSGKCHEGAQLDAISAFAIGVISKIVATTATYPLIRAKVFLMLSGEQQAKGLDSCLRLIVKESGYTGLYAGYRAQLLHVVLRSSILLALKEKITNSVIAQSGSSTKYCE